MQGSGQQRGPMPGLPPQQNPMQSLQNNGMQGQQFGGGATSPTSMGQQLQPNGQFQPQMNAGHAMGNMGQINLSNLSPQDRQRQLMVMQQQQQQQQLHQRNQAGGGGNSQNPGFMNNDQYALAQERFQQQRMSQGSSSAGSPPGGLVNDFPTLRSNASIPGIARSTRSPSDGAPSPQMQRNFQPDMRRLMAGSASGMGGHIPSQNPPLPNWQLKNQQTQQHQSMSMGQFQHPSANQYGGGGVGQGQNQWSGYPLASSPNSGGFQPERSGTPRQTSQTPGPQQQMQVHSPPIPGGEFDFFNLGGTG